MPYWLMPKESKQGINFISRTIRHLVNVGGEDVVGIGTDFDGFTTPPDDLIDASQMPRLTQRLVIDGYTPRADQEDPGRQCAARSARRLGKENSDEPMSPESGRRGRNAFETQEPAQ